MISQLEALQVAALCLLSVMLLGGCQPRTRSQVISGGSAMAPRGTNPTTVWDWVREGGWLLPEGPCGVFGAREVQDRVCLGAGPSLF